MARGKLLVIEKGTWSVPKKSASIRLADPEIDRRLKEGPDLVSANFVIPYPPGFPIMVPGQVISKETIDFMRKLDVKEIHGYEGVKGLKLVRTDAMAKRAGPSPKRAAA